jgi:hypothetical protein
MPGRSNSSKLQVSPTGPLCVKLRVSHAEQMFSGIPLKASVKWRWQFLEVPREIILSGNIGTAIHSEQFCSDIAEWRRLLSSNARRLRRRPTC